MLPLKHIAPLLPPPLPPLPKHIAPPCPLSRPLPLPARSPVLRVPLREAVGVGIMASEKSAPIAITAIAFLTPNLSQQARGP